MRTWIKERAYAFPVLLTLLLFLVLNAIVSPTFIKPENWNGFIVGAAPFVITALAQTMPVLSGDGGIDLSVGPLAGMVNAVVAGLLVPFGWSDPASVIGISLIIGLASGLLNGAMVAFIRVQPIITTLGIFLAYQGITLEILPQAGGAAPNWLKSVGETHFGIPAMVWPIILIAIAWLALERTAFRRNLLATGGDARAAFASGVNVAVVRLIAYAIAGTLAAIAGLAFTAALGSGDPRVGAPYTLTSIASVALGGVALTGGRGGLLGAAAAGALLFLIQNLFTLAQVSIFYLQIAYGVILLGALYLNSFADRMRNKRIQSRLS